MDSAFSGACRAEVDRAHLGRCVALRPGASGSFQLALLRLKENAPDLLFRERLQWSAPTTTAEIPLSTDEAVERSWIEGVSPCLCAP
jgi:hypothetical protein